MVRFPKKGDPMKCNLALVIGSFLFAGLVAQGATFEYKLAGYPASEQGCHAQANNLGTEFSKTTGTKVVSSLCLGEKDDFRTFSIRYQSDKELRVVTNQGRSLHDPAGRYKTFEDCEEEIDNVADRFAKATGLPSTFAFCTPVRASQRFPFAPRVDGFGEPKLEPLIGGYLIFGVPKKITGPQYRAAIASALAGVGAQFDALVIHSQMAYARVSIHYFGNKEVDFNLQEHTKTDTEKQCLAQIGQLQTIYKKGGPALVYCGHVHVGNQYEINALYLGSPSLTTRESVESYKTFADCEADRERLVRFYQKDLGQDVRGGLCTRLVGERSYKVALFEPR